MSRNESAIVIGAGVVGLCVARALTQRGVRVTVLDPGPVEKAASWGNAGHLAVEHVEPLASPGVLGSLPRRWFGAGGALDFVWSDVAAWAPWSLAFLGACTQERFARATGLMESLTAQAIPAWRRLLGPAAEAHLRAEGHVSLWEGASAAGRAATAMARRRTGAARYEPLTERDRALVASRLSISADGVRFSSTGQVADPVALLAHLREAHAQAQGAFRQERAAHVAAGENGAEIALESGERLRADLAVVCAGVSSRALLKDAGLPAPLIAERGYHVELPAGDWPEALSPIVFEDRSVVLTRFGARLRATSFVEFGKASSPPDPRKWVRLERHLRALGVLQGHAAARWMGARPTLPDYLPGIGGGERPGLFYCVGHSHLGLTLAALTGELIGDLALGHRPAIELAPFSLARFAGAGPSMDEGAFAHRRMEEAS